MLSVSCIEILILRLFLGDFRRGKRVLGIVAHFCLLSAKFKGFLRGCCFLEYYIYLCREKNKRTSIMESRDIERVLREMLGTFEEKNALYGNSFEESLREWGALVGVSRIGDKMRRLKSLWMSSGCDSGVFVSSGGCGESVRDTLLDMANYCVMMIVAMDGGVFKGDSDDEK